MTHSRIVWRLCSRYVALFLFAMGMSHGVLSDDFRIEEAKWERGDKLLVVKGKRQSGRDVTVTNADTGEYVGSNTRDGEEWRLRKNYSDTSSVPCRVRAEQQGGQVDERSVKDAPSDCDDGGGGGGEPPPDIGLPNQTDFKMMMNYELGMHCTGFEFAYCCVLPVYNSILSQVVKPEGSSGNDFPYLLEGDPNYNTEADALVRETVVRDPSLDRNGDFNKYVMRYWHDAQPRESGAAQTSTKISGVEGKSLLAWNTLADAAALNGDGSFVKGTYNGANNVVLGNGSYTDVDDVFGVNVDNYQNAVWNHLYVYDVSAAGVEGERRCKVNPDEMCFTDDDCSSGACGYSGEDRKVRLGLHLGYPENFGPGGHGMEGLLTFSGETGTVVYTQMKVLENLPITLTSPRIWEALGLPLTPFEDSIGFFASPGDVDEDSIRPYVQMKAQLYHADCNADGVCVEGEPVMDSSDNPVIGFGTAPIDIPNCERCHSAPPERCTSNPALDFDDELCTATATNVNSPNTVADGSWALVQQEMNFWLAYYPDMQTGSDWYARLKGAAISIMAVHDDEHGTDFTEFYPGVECAAGGCPGLTDPRAGSVGDILAQDDPLDPRLALPQNTRLGHESVICQKCHADNVIAVVKSANCGAGSNCDVTATDQLFENIAGNDPDTGAGHLIPPLTEAIHWNHREVSEGGTIDFVDAQGRSGGCQGCHPAHRSDGNMTGYPIDLDGNNFYAGADNRDANGGCFVGRDVHSNPMKDIDGAETPEHLNPVGEWLKTNVANSGGTWKGIWCTNCHSQAGQELWRAENVADLVNAQPGDPGHVREPANDSLAGVVAALNAATVYASDCTAPESSVGQECLADADCDSDPDANDGAGSGDGVCSNDGLTVSEFEAWLDPKAGHPKGNKTSTIWAPDPGICNHVGTLFGGAQNAGQDANVATIEVAIGSEDGSECSTGIGLPGPDCTGPDDGSAPTFFICGSVDGDTDVNVSLLSYGLTSEDGSGTPCDPETEGCIEQSPFCTTADCVAAANQYLADNGYTTAAVPVPMSAATDGRDHWLAPGEPHCADCHEAPYVEQSGNINAFPPFNYPRKASLMRYSRGHQDITCQGCHESIHGLYPVTSNIDTTSYAQAASLNDDNTHGPLKCGTCHDTNSEGVWRDADRITYKGQRIRDNFDAAVGWMHTFTDEADPRVDFCRNCHSDETDEIFDEGRWGEEWLEHSMRGRVSRSTMDQVEILERGHVAGDPDYENPRYTVCRSCHGDEWGEVSCNEREWKEHLTEGRVSHKVWEHVSTQRTGGTCGW